MVIDRADVELEPAAELELTLRGTTSRPAYYEVERGGALLASGGLWPGVAVDLSLPEGPCTVRLIELADLRDAVIGGRFVHPARWPTGGDEELDRRRIHLEAGTLRRVALRDPR